jgi:hypothetical protein
VLDTYQRNLAELRAEVLAFGEMLRPGTALSEQRDILPFFNRSRHLAAYFGYANNNLISPNLLRIEPTLLGFRCDIALGDAVSGQFTLVELEDAAPGSIFNTARHGRAFPMWSYRFERGFSQLVDWAWRIGHERQPGVVLQPIFGTTDPKIHHLLVIGRDHWLDATAGARLEWRRMHNAIQWQLTSIWTYDYFLGHVRRRIADADADIASARSSSRRRSAR